MINVFSTIVLRNIYYFMSEFSPGELQEDFQEFLRKNQDSTQDKFLSDFEKKQ